jgi:hypothetical protein
VSKIEDGGAAFPIAGFDDGMTLRDYFAAVALQGMMGNRSLVDTFSGHAVMAEKSYFLADAMLAARKGDA